MRLHFFVSLRLTVQSEPISVTRRACTIAVSRDSQEGTAMTLLFKTTLRQTAAGPASRFLRRASVLIVEKRICVGAAVSVEFADTEQFVTVCLIWSRFGLKLLR